MHRTKSHNRLLHAFAAGLLVIPSITSLRAGPSNMVEPGRMGKSPSLETESSIPAPASFADLWTNAKLTGDFRLRYEYGDQDGLKASHAGTLRSRIGVMTGSYAGFSAFAEYEGTLVADKNSYQAASVHGTGQGKTIIADPESNELNRAWLQWTGGGTTIKAGRQRIILNNARYIGNIGWRQNGQTFDAVTLKQSIGDFDFTYGSIFQTLRIFGSEKPANPGQTDFDGGTSHLGHITYGGMEGMKLGAFAYLLDLANDAGSANSNNSYGLYLNGFTALGSGLKLTYYAEYGYQTDAFDSPLDYQASYFHFKSALVKDKNSFGVGFESLGSDNGVGYKFPLGTNHAFNGFADKFLGTPADGLQDLYVFGGTALPGGLALKVFYHWFGSDEGSLEYGQEIDAVLVKKLSDNLTVVAKGAYYMADDFASDTTRASIELGYKF